MSHSPDLDLFLAQARFSGIHLGAAYCMSLALRQDHLYLVIEGSMTQHIPDEFTDTVEAGLTLMPTARLVVDLTKTTHISSVTIAYLVSYVKHAQGRGQKQVPLLRANARIATLVKMVGLNDFFVHCANEAEVAAALNK